jgi:hypothetical protein
MKLKVSVFSVATNVYFDYWLKMYETANKNLFPDTELTFHLFSNIKPSIHQRDLIGSNVVIHEIVDLRWPEATLKRYELIVKNFPQVEADVLVYLDADMLINQVIELSTIYDAHTDSVVLVRHPGYWRPSFHEDRTFYFRHLDLAVKDSLTWMRFGGIGAWECYQKSQAFVARSMRKRYYCGGFWLGKKTSIIDLAELMSQRVEVDSRNKITAIWHDESHLNKWATSNSFRSLDSSYCFAEGYKNLDNLPQRITAVTKKDFTR